MSDYHLHVLHASMVSRERAVWAWEEADRIEALVLQEGVVDALKKIGWIVDVDDSEADYGQTRWLLWVRGQLEFIDVVAGTPLGYLGLLKPVSLLPDTELDAREWIDRVRVERGGDPEPPAPGNILERLLDRLTRKELIESLDDPDFGDAEKILAAWAMYRDRDQAIRAGNPQNGDSAATLPSPVCARRLAPLGTVPVLREKLLKLVRATRRCDDHAARLADLEHQRDDLRAILGEWGIDPDTVGFPKGN